MLLRWEAAEVVCRKGLYALLMGGWLQRHHVMLPLECTHRVSPRCTGCSADAQMLSLSMSGTAIWRCCSVTIAALVRASLNAATALTADGSLVVMATMSEGAEAWKSLSPPAWHTTPHYDER